MATIKFGELERKRVIDVVEKLRNVKLKQIGNFRKFLTGSDGSRYCILGGTADRHGIPKEIIEDGFKNCDAFYLIIARLLVTRIEVYMGPMKPLIDGRDSLTHNLRGDFQFDLRMPEDNRLPIKQIPTAKLDKICEFSYNLRDEREMDHKIEDFLKKLSPDQKRMA